MRELPQRLILFDGVCNLCNSAVQYVIRHDKKGRFKFASLQSETGKKIISEFNLPPNDPDSFVLIQNNQAFIKSTAAIKVAKQLDGVIKILYGFIIVPVFIRDVVYDFIAKYRYRWFGKRESCMIPAPSLESRFLK